MHADGAFINKQTGRLLQIMSPYVSDISQCIAGADAYIIHMYKYIHMLRHWLVTPYVHSETSNIESEEVR
jgi:hypothetical protein